MDTNLKMFKINLGCIVIFKTLINHTFAALSLLLSSPVSKMFKRLTLLSDSVSFLVFKVSKTLLKKVSIRQNYPWLQMDPKFGTVETFLKGYH